jgi:general secretion pathway protein B
MSYILDALRKSEQQRLQGAAPLLITTQLSNVEKQPTFLFYGLLAGALICAGILIGWLRPWQHDETVKPANDVAVLAQTEIETPQVAPKQESKPLPSLEFFPLEPVKATKPEPATVLPSQKPIPSIKPASKANSAEQTAPVPINIPAQSRESQAGTVKPKVENQKVQAQKEPETKVEEAAKPAIEKVQQPSPEPIANGSSEATQEQRQDQKLEQKPEQKVVAMSALPTAIQQEIPAMTISGYAYSSIPKERSVGINDRLLQEGEFLAPGLRLEQITEDGLIFSYKKYLFRHTL